MRKSDVCEEMMVYDQPPDVWFNNKFNSSLLMSASTSKACKYDKKHKVKS